MAVLADRYGAQIAPVAVAHSLRVSLVVILIPFALTYGGFPLEVGPYIGPPSRSQFRSSQSGWLLVGCWGKSPKDFNFITAVFWCRFFSVRR